MSIKFDASHVHRHKLSEELRKKSITQQAATTAAQLKTKTLLSDS